MKIKSIKQINRKNETVFNLEVANNHNYYANGMLVSNCHAVRRGNENNKLLKDINTTHIFGFTGTMPEDKIDQWNVIGKIGPIIYEKHSKDLRDNKQISEALIQILQINYKNKFISKKTNTINDPLAQYEEEYQYIFNNSFRNSIIAKLANKLDKNVLILVDRIDHGLAIKNAVENIAINKKIYFIRGSVEVEEREEIRKLMESSDQVICIAVSKIFSTGINISNLHYIIFAAIGKAKVKVIQSIGRGLRLHEDKQKLVIFDITDKLEYSLKHLAKRRILYEKERFDYKIKEINEG